jgi:anti-anti-sigma factor
VSDSIHDEPPSAGSSFKLGELPEDPAVLKVYQTGELTVVGFGGQDVPDEVCIAAYRTQLFDMIAQHNCKVLAFDLTGVQLVPSGMLGVLTSIRQKVERVELYNPSPDVRQVLRITNLDRLFDIKEVAV